MAAARRYPLRINDTVDAACARVRAGMFAEGVSVSSVTKVWAASAGRVAAATVVAFILRNSSNRRERRQRRSEARAAAFRARRSAGVAIEEARAAGEEYARELVAFAGTSEGAPSSFRVSGAGEVQDAAPPLAEHRTETEEAAGGISLVLPRVYCNGAGAPGSHAAALSGGNTRSPFSGGGERGASLSVIGSRASCSGGGALAATPPRTGALLSSSVGGELCMLAPGAGARWPFSGGGARAFVPSSGLGCWKRQRWRRSPRY